MLHLLYSRFISMALHDMGHFDFEEPYRRFRGHGLLILRGSKISKSRGNVVSPDEYVVSHGADTLRTYLMFSGRYDEGGDFSDQGIEGCARFLHRVWDIVQRHKDQGGDGDVPIEAQRLMHRTVKKVTRDIPGLKYNTAISALMEWSNQLQQRPSVSSAEVRTLLLLLAPIAPYVTEELWEQIGESYSIHAAAWPAFDEALARLQEVEVAVQIDGKTRDVIQLEAGAAEATAVSLARESARVERHLGGRTVVRAIYVPDRLINFVTSR